MKHSDITSRQLAANRANAQKSSGPKTPEGKAASSQNAVTHGITARFRVLSSEDADRFAIVRDDFFRRFRPVDEYEVHKVHEIALIFWHQRRLREIEDEHYEIHITDPTIRDGFNELEGSPLNAVAHSRLCKSGELALVNRQLSRLSREYHRAVQLFVQLRRDLPPVADDGFQPALECAPQAGQNEPIPISEHSPEMAPEQPEIAANSMRKLVRSHENEVKTALPRVEQAVPPAVTEVPQIAHWESAEDLTAEPAAQSARSRPLGAAA